MARFIASLSIIISLVIGLLVIREVFALLPPWSKEVWYLLVIDSVILLASFFLVSWLVFFLLSDVLTWLLEKIKRRFRGL